MVGRRRPLLRDVRRGRRAARTPAPRIALCGAGSSESPPPRETSRAQAGDLDARDGGSAAAAGAPATSQAPCAAEVRLGAVTSSIIRSYASRAVSPNEKKPWLSSTMPTVLRPGLGSGNARRTAAPGRSRASRTGSPPPSRRRSRGRAAAPSAVLVIASSASAWVWSTNWYGSIACRIVSTDGVGADGSVIAARSSLDHLRDRTAAPGWPAAARGRSRTGAKPGRLDRLQVPAAAFDVQDVLLVAEDVALADLHRGVAAAVQHQRRDPAPAGARCRRAARASPDSPPPLRRSTGSRP